MLSSVERRDVGITLKITPQITEGDYVKLNLYQEISSVKDESENITISVVPTTTKRATKTSVVVRDRQTVVISGLMQEEEEESTLKTPLLGDIPVVGWLFKHKGSTRKKTNLLVFVTPHIVKDSLQLAKITSDKRDEFSENEKHYIEGELLIRFTEETTDASAIEIIQQRGASIIRVNKRLRLYHIKLRPEQTVEEAIEEYSTLPEILYAEPNYKIKIQKKEDIPEQGFGIQ